MDFQRHRIERRSEAERPGEHRSPFDKDRDRILYSHAFLRLAGVTQVSSRVTSGRAHERYGHSVKVAQVGRSLARAARRAYSHALPDIAHHLEPTVVEAAGLAHDLGHPPFGHKGEEVLDRWIRDSGAVGFEGNAQTFRVVTRLGDRHFQRKGFDLTRAVIAATIKYPRTEMSGEPKYSAYSADEDNYRWAVEATQAAYGVPTLEAQIMDWADDITYAVHDAQDYYREGLVRLDQMLSDTTPQADYVEWLVKGLRDRESGPPYSDWTPELLEGDQSTPPEGWDDVDWTRTGGELRKILSEIGDPWFLGLRASGRYNGSVVQRGILVNGVSQILSTAIDGPTTLLDPVPFSITHQTEKCPDGEEHRVWRFTPNREVRRVILLLKGLLWWDVVPSLDTEQSKRETWTEEVLALLWAAVKEGRKLPIGASHLDSRPDDVSAHSDAELARFVADWFAGLTDEEARAFYVVLVEASGASEPVELESVVKTAPWPAPPWIDQEPLVR